MPLSVHNDGYLLVEAEFAERSVGLSLLDVAGEETEVHIMQLVYRLLANHRSCLRSSLRRV